MADLIENRMSAPACNLRMTIARDITSARQAAAAVRGWLQARDLDASKVSARTVSFSDLARCSRIFVEVGNWKPNPISGELKEFANAQGFYVTFTGEGGN